MPMVKAAPRDQGPPPRLQEVVEEVWRLESRKSNRYRRRAVSGSHLPRWSLVPKLVFMIGIIKALIAAHVLTNWLLKTIAGVETCGRAGFAVECNSPTSNVLELIILIDPMACNRLGSIGRQNALADPKGFGVCFYHSSFISLIFFLFISLPSLFLKK